MSRFIQQPKDKAKSKKVERKIPLSKPGSQGYNQKVMEAAKPLYMTTGKA